MILRAKIVLPVTAPPIEDGAVFVAGNKIRAVAPWKNLRPHLREKVLNLGEVILLPGLVNAHCHLDYTDMAGELSPPKTFVDWIAAITAHKTGWSYSDYARSWLRGAHQLLKTGTTTVGRHRGHARFAAGSLGATPLRVFSFLEMTGIKSRRAPREILREAVEKIESLRASAQPRLRSRRTRPIPLCRNSCTAPPASPRNENGASASTSPSPRRNLKCSSTRAARCTTGSSATDATTPTAATARPSLISPARNCSAKMSSPSTSTASRAATPRCSPKTRPTSSIVRAATTISNIRRFERVRLAQAGVNICLGTDSLATVRKTGKQKPELDLFAEMRALADKDKTISPDEILQMATVNGARALGLAGKTGELSPGAFADLIAIPFSGKISGSTKRCWNMPAMSPPA